MIHLNIIIARISIHNRTDHNIYNFLCYIFEINIIKIKK